MTNHTNILYPFSNTFVDYPSDEHNAILVFMTGCNHACMNCQNPQFKNPDNKLATETYLDSFLQVLGESVIKNRTNKVVLSGGDPLASFNLEFTKSFLKNTEFDVCVYTGHDIEYVKQHDVTGFQFIKCGTYDETKSQMPEKTDDYLRFASTNQELFDEQYNKISKNGTYYFNSRERKCTTMKTSQQRKHLTT